MNQRLGRQGVSISLIVVWQTTNEFPKVCPEITIDFRSTCILLCHSQIPFSQIKLISIINSKTNMNIWKYEGEWQWEEAWICYHLLCYAFQVLAGRMSNSDWETRINTQRVSHEAVVDMIRETTRILLPQMPTEIETVCQGHSYLMHYENIE